VAAVGAWLEISLVYLDVGWSEAALLAVLLVSLAASVLVWQYLARQTRRAAIALGTGCLLIAALLGANFFPAAGALEALIVGPDEAGPTLAIGEPLDLDALPPLPPGSFIPGPLFAIPLRASDADPRNFVLTDIELRLRNSDGYQYRIGAAAAYGNSLAIVFPANFLQRAADTPLEGTIDFKLIQYRDSAAGEINMDGSANTIAAGIQCGNRIANQGRWLLHCRSAAALPEEWEVVTLTSGMTVARLTRAVREVSVLPPISQFSVPTRMSASLFRLCG
jgi:hypothetical protein